MILEQLVDFVELVLANDTFKLLLLLEESSLVLGLEWRGTYSQKNLPTGWSSCCVGGFFRASA